LIVMPGVTTRKARENFWLPGWRAALTVCQGDQHRHDRRLAGPGRELQRDAQQLWVRLLVGAPDVRPDFGARCCRSEATSASQIAVSIASIWQKNGLRLSNDDAASAGGAGRSRCHLPLVGVGRLRQAAT